MAMLETQTGSGINAADRPFFVLQNEIHVENDPLHKSVEEARKIILPMVLDKIDKMDYLVAARKDSDEELHEQRLKIYDAESMVRGCAEKIASNLQDSLKPNLYKIGDTMYMIIEDPHHKSGSKNWLIMLDDDKCVSFMEPRGLYGDDDFTRAQYQHHTTLIEDVIAHNSQP